MKTELEHLIEQTLERWHFIKTANKQSNEYNFKQRITKGMEMLKAVDDDYVCEAAKVMFGEDVELTQERIDVLRPACIEIILAKIDQMFPLYDE